MSAGSRQPDWYLNDGQAEVGPLTEVELRKRLAGASKVDLERQKVRQGSSAWYPAARVLARFKELAQNGVFIKSGEKVSGPFTAERAAELLRNDNGPGSDSAKLVRIGRQEQWQTSAQFLELVDRLERQRQSKETSQPQLIPATLVEESPMLFQATLLEEAQSPRSDKPRRVVVNPTPVVVNPTPVRTPAPANTRGFADPFVQASAIPHDPLATTTYTAPTRFITPVTAQPKTPQAPKANGDEGTSNTVKGVVGGVVSVIIALSFIGLKAYNRYQRRLAREGEMHERAPRPTFSQPTLTSGNSAAPDRPAINPNNPFASPSNSGAAPERNARQGMPGGREPVITTGMIFRPTFKMMDGEYAAGTCFAARITGSQRPIIISALHLMGPAGGMKADIPPRALDNVWKSISLTDCVAQRDLGDIPGDVIVLEHAMPFPKMSMMGDVIAYMPDSIEPFRPLELSRNIPTPGETVWLVSEVVGSTQIKHRAVVDGIEGGWLVYRFEDKNLELRATSGAPVVNSRDEVVAINEGGGEDDGTMRGIGTPTFRFFEQLAIAAGLR